MLYTPNGLKIRLSPKYAFSLLSRVLPIKPEQVLYLTEALVRLPIVIGRLMLVIAVINHKPLTTMIIMGLFGNILGQLVIHCRLLIVPGVSLIVRLLALSSSYAFDLALLIGSGLYIGWRSVPYVLTARVVFAISGFIVESQILRLVHRTNDSHLTLSEICFFHAFRSTASRMGQDPNLELLDREKNRDFWKVPFLEYASQFPNCVPDIELK